MAWGDVEVFVSTGEQSREEVPTMLEHPNHGSRVVGGGTPGAETGMDPSALLSSVAFVTCDEELGKDLQVSTQVCVSERRHQKGRWIHCRAPAMPVNQQDRLWAPL